MIDFWMKGMESEGEDGMREGGMARKKLYGNVF